MKKKSENSICVPPTNPAIKVWRYMDLSKFVAMLEYQGLFFPRSHTLGDPFEGSFSKVNELFREFVYEGTWVDEETREWRSEFQKWVRRWVMVCCWHMNEHESAALWKIYAQTEKAVAVQTTYQRLEECLGDINIGVVHYIDYSTEWMPEHNFFYPFLCKLKSFEHEREVRAIICDAPKKDGHPDYSAEPPNTGVWKNVSLERLIENVYVAPYSADWFRSLVERLVKRYNLRSAVLQSGLSEAPFF